MTPEQKSNVLVGLLARGPQVTRSWSAKALVVTLPAARMDELTASAGVRSQGFAGRD